MLNESNDYHKYFPTLESVYFQFILHDVKYTYLFIFRVLFLFFCMFGSHTKDVNKKYKILCFIAGYELLISTTLQRKCNIHKKTTTQTAISAAATTTILVVNNI